MNFLNLTTFDIGLADANAKNLYAILTQDAAPAVGAVLAGLALFLIESWLLGKLFRKAGRPAWQGWIPGLNVFVFLEIGMVSGWIVLLGVIPALGPLAVFVAMAMAARRIDIHLLKRPGWTVAFVLLEPLWLAVNALDRSTWRRVK